MTHYHRATKKKRRRVGGISTGNTNTDNLAEKGAKVEVCTSTGTFTYLSIVTATIVFMEALTATPCK